MTSRAAPDEAAMIDLVPHANPPGHERTGQDMKHVECVSPASDILEYDDIDEEPELHARTYLALAAMFLLNMVQVFALQGPPAVLSHIGKDLNNPSALTWVPNALSLVQAVLAPILASASDTFQARKSVLVGFTTISFIGAAIAPGSTNIYRLIAAQVLIGFGFSTVPLAYCVPSEILPRKWRPMAQAAINIAAVIGACAGPLIIGALTKANPHTGWRNFYWIQMGLWGMTSICLFVGYRPPKRYTRFDHLSVWAKIGRLDLPGCGLLAAGLTLLLAALNLGGNIFAWTAAPVLITLIVGIVLLVAFGVYEWKFTQSGILHHDLFREGKDGGRTFAICIGLIFIEGIMLFSYMIFYPVLTTSLFETDLFLQAARGQPYWVAAGVSTVIYGYASTKFRTIRLPLFIGFVLFTAGVVGFATIQPGDSTRAIIFAGISGLGFGGPLILITAGVQLSAPHHLIATATAATTCSRAVSSTAFTAIYSATLANRLAKYIPGYVAAAALRAGLPKDLLPGFIEALTNNDVAALHGITGVTSGILDAGVAALKQAYADSIRAVFFIAAPFGALACIACFFLGDIEKTMTYHVDAPVENLHAKHHKQRPGTEI